MNKIGAILFDLDGTLLDSAPDLVAALNWVRACEGLPALEVDQMSRHVSHGAAGLIRAGMPSTEEPQFEAWKGMLVARYAEHSYINSRLYDGVPELLEFLAQRAIPWGIVTNKSEALTHPVLRAADLADKTSCVVCGDTVGRGKPDPAPVLHACKILGIPQHQILFAGDDIRDLQAGRAAGTMTAVIHYGYGSYEMSDALVADSIQVHHPADFAELVG